ncbi:Uncharacterized protein TCM_007843 [Theobroma cacao]|uniref:Uncharacterized protein n=1 Tax=Theobroma cacao TaxID=3641 RepID=A0A061E2T2_THECC|nr:Uncharacterized protein TCM_007843 [Theobroma cacao]
MLISCAHTFYVGVFSLRKMSKCVSFYERTLGMVVATRGELFFMGCSVVSGVLCFQFLGFLIGMGFLLKLLHSTPR